MDLKDWEKISSDKKTTKLKHKSGHFMIIAHTALPKIQQEALKRLKMAKGGEIGDILDSGEGGTSEQGHDVRAAKRMRAPGRGKDEESAKVYDKVAKDEARGRMAMEKTVKPKMKGLAEGGEVQHFDEGTKKPIVSSSPETTAQDQANLDQAMPAPDAPVPTGPPPAQDQPSMLLPDQTANIPGAVEMGQKAIEAGVPIESAIARGKARATDQYLNERGEEGDKDVQAIQDLGRHAHGLDKYMQDHNMGVNENQFIDEMGSTKKVMTAIGLALGGFGTAFGGHNYAQDFLKDQIDRNIAAQKARAENAKSVWGAYKDYYGDENIANNMAKATTIDRLAHQVDAVTLQQGTPLAAKNALDLKSKLAFEKQQAIFDAAKIRGALPAVNGKQAPGQPTRPGQKPPSQPGPMAAQDPNWKDMDYRPGDGRVPKTNAPPQISIDYDKMKRSQMLGAQGVPGQILPGEVGEANESADRANSVNQAIKEIHNQYVEMWKNANQSTDATSYIAHQGLGGLSLPDMTNWTENSKRYYTAASAVTKQVANAMKGGGSDELYRLIGNQLIRPNDKASDYRQKLENLDNVLRQPLGTTVLKKYKMAKGLPGES